jgi:truncated hemoglobin YjbI
VCLLVGCRADESLLSRPADVVAHLPLPIDTPHFDRWLEIFAETAGIICPPSAAAHFLERAHRIANSLELGIAA